MFCFFSFLLSRELCCEVKPNEKRRRTNERTNDAHTPETAVEAMDLDRAAVTRGTLRVGFVVVLRRWHPLAKTASLLDRENPRRFDIGPLTCCCLPALLDALAIVILPASLVDEMTSALLEIQEQEHHV